MGDQIKKLIKVIEQCETEYTEACALLEKRSNEAKGLAEGLEKYRNDKVMFSQLKQLVINKYNEIKELKNRLEAIDAKAQKAKIQLESVSIISDKKETVLNRPNSISVSSACEKALDQVMQEKEPAKPEAPKQAVETVKETVVKEPLKAKKEKKLNDIARSEASTQEKFIKTQSKNLKYYGQA